MTTNDRDLIAEIDTLIDDQLAAGETRTTERAAPAADRRCGHCGRDWHGLAITRRLEDMRIEYRQRARTADDRGEEPEYAESAILDGYRYDEDDSDVLCPGSDFIGPVPPTFQPRPPCGCPGCTIARYFDIGVPASAPVYPREFLWSIPDYPWFDPSTNPSNARWWRLDNPSPTCSYELVNDDDERGFGPWGYREVWAPRREWLMVRTASGSMEKVELFSEPESRNSIIWHYSYDGHRSIEIYAYQPPSLGGTWHPISAPGARRPSQALVPTAWLDRIFDDTGLWFLAPRELAAVADRARTGPFTQLADSLAGALRPATDRIRAMLDELNRPGLIEQTIEPGQRDNEQTITISDPNTEPAFTTDQPVNRAARRRTPHNDPFWVGRADGRRGRR